MWARACELIDRAERLHRQFFQPTAAPVRDLCWEPPVDIIETDFELLIGVALPGVNSSAVKVTVDDPLSAHFDQLGRYTDADMHNVYAYLESLK